MRLLQLLTAWWVVNNLINFDLCVDVGTVIIRDWDAASTSQVKMIIPREKEKSELSYESEKIRLGESMYIYIL